MNFSNLTTLSTQLLLAATLSLSMATPSKAMSSAISSKAISSVTVGSLITSVPIGTAVLPTAKAMPAIANKQSEEQVPGRRRGGARRGTCPNMPVPLTALVPAHIDDRQPLPTVYVGGLTVAARPTFWFYVPYPLSSEMSAEFILQDAGTDIYRVALTAMPATSPSLVSVTLPASVTPLEIDKTYQWYFKVNCTSESPPFVQGGIRRIALDPTLADQLATASPSEQVELYRANNIWLDAIATLSDLQQANPSDRAIAADWKNLLESIGINDVSLNNDPFSDVPLNSTTP